MTAKAPGPIPPVAKAKAIADMVKTCWCQRQRKLVRGQSEDSTEPTIEKAKEALASGSDRLADLRT